jgi:hypothetical protein
MDRLLDLVVVQFAVHHRWGIFGGEPVTFQLPGHDLLLDLSRRPFVASSSCLRLRNPWSTAGQWWVETYQCSTTPHLPVLVLPYPHVRLLPVDLRVSSFSQQPWPMAVKGACLREALPGGSRKATVHEPDCQTVTQAMASYDNANVCFSFLELLATKSCYGLRNAQFFSQLL